MDARCGPGRGREAYSNFSFVRATVPGVCDEGCRILVLGHSGRLLHMWANCTLTAEVMFVHGVG